MLETFYVILAALINSAGDRVRGTGAPAFYGAALTGAVIYTSTLLLFMPDNGVHTFVYGGVAVLAIIMYLVGESWGWGEPLGAYLAKRPMDPDKLEPWQVGVLAKSAALSLVVRGAMWGAPIALLLVFYGTLALALSVLVAYTVSFWLSPFLCRFTHLDTTHKWELSETVRGALVVLIGGGTYVYFVYQDILLFPVIEQLVTPIDIITSLMP